MKSKLLKRTYRITPEEDRLVKKYAKNCGGESSLIRNLISTLKPKKHTIVAKGKMYIYNGSVSPTPKKVGVGR